MGIKKSFFHFLQLLKEGKLKEIFRITNYYFMDKIVRRFFILLTKIKGIFRRSKNYHSCPSCQREFPFFYPIMCGNHIAFNVQCPYCKSYERHRSQWLYYTRETDMFAPKQPISVLHCAPEELFFPKFFKKELVDYYPIDKWTGFTVCGEKMRDYADITKLPYEDNKFDYILCNHVLEHIPDEQLALAQLKRVLKPDGIAFLNVPIDSNLENTLEDPAYNTDELRLKYYGQCDHVRKFGLDYGKHLEAAGFQVTCILVEEYFSQEEINRYGLLPDERIYCCKK